MAYEEMMVEAGNGALPGGGMMNGGGMGGGPQDEVGALIEARAQIDARLEQLGVPVAMLNADAGGVPGGIPGAVPGAEVAMGGMPMAGPNMGMPPAGLLG